ncbi:uncharacterized protein LOC121504734 [Cheilinus undulatus]|uniref:uncharacterized protein LOC121504734 n=1 Tax=Cheilinus undulatus TaxID=241271 RepID=UPI001BD2CAEB|nr:uncharacterized protein LOC121504734 [Cheilinus undulatus]
MMTSPVFVFCLTCLCFGSMAQTPDVSRGSSLSKESGFISANIGETVTLLCFFQGDAAAKFYWYKQTLGQRPTLISSYYTHGTSSTFHGELKDNPRFTLDAKPGQNHLRIADVQISDTAVYYCSYSYSFMFEFKEGITLSVRGSGRDVKLLNQSENETIQPGGSVTLSCVVNTGSCDGEHSVYWFKNSEGAEPGLIYTHGGNNNKCERKPSQQSCEYNLPLRSLSRSHAGTYYCAVVSCGQILFGDGTKLDFKDEENFLGLVYILNGALTFTIILVVLLAVCLCVITKRNNYSPAADLSAATEQGDCNEENIHYAALREQRVNRSRRQGNNTNAECVYSSVKQ